MAPAGVAHDWWNAGDEEAHVVVEIRPAARFEEMIRNTYGLAQDGKTDAKGMPSLLQLALLAREFDDTIRFTKPPRIVQRLLFSVLAPVARLRGLRNLAWNPQVFYPVLPKGNIYLGGVASSGVVALTGNYANLPGQVFLKAPFTLIFARAGVYKYYCLIHPGMAGTITVLPATAASGST